MALSAAWTIRFDELLPLFGHRNWIAVADSAYPAHSNPGIETLVTSDDHISVVQHVFARITDAKHVGVNIYGDRELTYLAEPDAPGIELYRQQLHVALDAVRVCHIPHEQLIEKLNQSAQSFKVLLIKTSLALPYSSIFFELNCGYWSSDAERRLAHSMSKASLPDNES